MNDKEKRIYDILDIVVSCCTMEINGKQSVTAQDVLGKSRAANVVMTRCIFITELLFSGFTTTTTAMVLNRTETDIRHLLEVAHNYRITSCAYRLAEAEATLRCKDLPS